MRYEVSFRPEAEADLFALYRYIARESGHKRAGNYIDSIEGACMSLATFPMRVVRVFYAGRDYDALFKRDDGE